jgi:uncharacterized protein (DUF2141 family)
MKTFAIVATLSAASAVATAHDLRVEVLNARSTNGFVAAAVYADGAGWLKAGQSVQVARVQAADKAVLVFANLPAGRYAVSVFHDENGNGKLDVNVMGIPTERYGFSRDARGPMGPPAFADAAVDVGADTAITVHLQ